MNAHSQSETTGVVLNPVPSPVELVENAHFGVRLARGGWAEAGLLGLSARVRGIVTVGTANRRHRPVLSCRAPTQRLKMQSSSPKAQARVRGLRSGCSRSCHSALPKIRPRLPRPVGPENPTGGAPMRRLSALGPGGRRFESGRSPSGRLRGRCHGAICRWLISPPRG